MAAHMMIASRGRGTNLSLITAGMKGGTKDNVGILCRRTSSVHGLFFHPVTATSRSCFLTRALIQRNKFSLRNRDSDLGLMGAVCTIGSYHPTTGSWGCKVKPPTHNLAASTIVTSVLFVSMILWDMRRGKKLERFFAAFLLSLCIILAIWAAKGDERAILLVTWFDKAGKIYKVLGHLLSIFGGLP